MLFPALAEESPDRDPFAAKRERMVREQMETRGINDPAVLSAMRNVPRHEFVAESARSEAYNDHPLPIGSGQTISQPFIVALMTQLARVKRGDKVLEVGTGSGYQAAVLKAIGCDVYTIEIVRELHAQAAGKLKTLGLDAERVVLGDGYKGLPRAAPFDAIIITAAPDHIPPPLVEQLKPGGRMVIPVGPTDGIQELTVLEKDADGKVRTRVTDPVRFVPLTRERQKK